MLPPLATLYETGLTVHRIFAVALLVLSFVIAVLSIIARGRPMQLEKALVFRRLGGPLMGVIVLTGAYLAVAGHVRPFQGWLIGSIVLAAAYMAVIERYWRARAERIYEHASADPEGEGEPDGGEREELAGLGVALIVLVIAAIWLMEHQPG